MIRRFLTLIGACALAANVQAQGVNVTSWLFNTTNHTYNGILTDVAAVYYTGSNVYIKASGIPFYYQHGLTVNDGADMAWTINIPRNPVQNTATLTTVGQGQIGIYLDGSMIFGPGDAQSYNNAGQWWRIAYFFEGQDFDTSNGHSTPGHTYHHHVYNKALASVMDSSKHSALVGFAFDGFPVYGAFGYANPTDASSAVTRMKTSYQKRNITSRTTLPNGNPATGPAIGGQYQLGVFVEDYIYTAGSGTLDEHNGRYCVTPEYPNGTYAYFKTLDENLEPEYPYQIGTTYYGVVQAGNTGPNGGHFTVPASATQYVPTTNGIEEETEVLTLNLYPNPSQGKLYIEQRPGVAYNVAVFDMKGQNLHIAANGNALDMEHLAAGTYLVVLTEKQSGRSAISKVVKQ